MARHYGPTKSQFVDFDAQTEQVYGVWCALWEQRKADATHTGRPANRMDMNAINRVIAENTDLGQLLRWAIDDAEAMPVDFAVSADATAALWTAQQRLHAEWTNLHPPMRLAVEQETSCRHGVPFADDCGDCDADF
jgi:hypothetical protein